MGQGYTGQGYTGQGYTGQCDATNQCVSADPGARRWRALQFLLMDWALCGSMRQYVPGQCVSAQCVSGESV
ncbi:MAG: hypothetical protein BM562_09835 [Alphaproteobacteria bacterium MedPE-SWcel]|nr:MAG: hypothetical protein BM562_09835 [Alphaproteobacteria bacterium MedPE-SWcel]